MTILITAGPTREPLDPVRYLTNRSSGKMGYALAQAAQQKGHRVILISGPTTIEVPDGIDFIPVETSEDMHRVVAEWINDCEIAIFAAAVADYKPAVVPNQKIKKSGDTLTLELIKTLDILGSARGELSFQGTLVGFAAETEKLEEHARAKLERKNCDLIVANDVSRSDIGFDSSHNEVLLVTQVGTEPIPKTTKEDLAELLMDRFLALHKRKITQAE